MGRPGKPHADQLAKIYTKAITGRLGACYGFNSVSNLGTDRSTLHADTTLTLTSPVSNRKDR